MTWKSCFHPLIWLADLVVEYPGDREGDAGDPDDRDDPDGADHLGLAGDAQGVADGEVALHGEGDDGEDRRVGDGLLREDLGVTDELSEIPRVLPPQKIKLEGHR